MVATDYDAIVVGAGPNGLAAAIAMRQRGLSVLLIEGRDKVGGGMRSAELTLPGFTHDICSAIHPLAASSPFFSTLPLADFGLEYLYPPVAAAHPFEDGGAAALVASVGETARRLGRDEEAYRRLMDPLAAAWPELAAQLLGPLRIPRHPLLLAQFGLSALTPVTRLAHRFETREARALMEGMAAHSIQPLSNLATSAYALVLLLAGHHKGWPLPRGGSFAIADALSAYFTQIGGKIETGTFITNLSQLPSCKALLLDMTPRQLLQLGGHRWSSLYKWQLERYRYGMGIYKIDWALEETIPWKAEICRETATVHLGGTMEEIVAGEAMAARGGYPERPFVLLAQQSLFDASRAPEGKSTAWAYCHVPNGSTRNMTDAIEAQVERFAPGFRERIIGRHVMDTVQLEDYNPNYVGGDINGGISDIGQLFTRPALRWSPYRTSEKGIYLCSQSTPPGGGVHGMCGWWAAQRALKDLF